MPLARRNLRVTRFRAANCCFSSAAVSAASPLAHLLTSGRAPGRSRPSPWASGAPDLNGGLHHRAKVKRVVQLFMNGGASPMDTFDYKPQLEKLHGKTFDPGGNVKLESVTGSPGFKVLKSPFEFKQHGQCGRWVSSVFPHLAGCVDDLAFLMSMSSKTNVHGPASYMQNTGFILPGFPCMGAWLSYGLGSLTRQPADVRRDPRRPRVALQQPREFFRRLPAGEASGDDHPPEPAEPDRRPVSAEIGPLHHGGKRTRRPGPAGRGQSRLRAAVAGRFAARSADRLLRAGRPHAAQPRPRRSTFRKKPPRRASCTAWTKSRPRPSAATA